MKYIINGITYTCPTAQPHDSLRELLIDAYMFGWKVEKIED